VFLVSFGKRRTNTEKSSALQNVGGFLSMGGAINTEVFVWSAGKKIHWNCVGPRMKRSASKSAGQKRTVDELTQQNVEKVSALEAAMKANATKGDRVADGITRFCGSMGFVALHALWYGVWIVANLVLPEHSRFDPFPFSFLTLIVSLEAIFLSAFILVSQNRQSILSERRSHLDLQIDMLAEQENTKMLELLEKIACKVGVEPCHDQEIKAMAEAVKPEHLAQQIEQSIQQTEKAA
jgi:uncharacterized membrane protein